MGAQRLEVCVQFIDQRTRCGNVQADDLFVGDVLKIFDQRAKRIAVRNDQHAFACGHLGGDDGFPVRNQARHRVLEAFGQRHLVFVQVRITGIVGGAARVGRKQLLRRDVIASAPAQNHFLAEFRRSFRLVQALQGAVMAFIEAPGGMNGDPHAVHRFHGYPQRPYRPFENRGVREFELEPRFGHEDSRAPRLFPPVFGQVHIGPAGKLIRFVPHGFAVAE